MSSSSFHLCFTTRKNVTDSLVWERKVVSACLSRTHLVPDPTPSSAPTPAYVSVLSPVVSPTTALALAYVSVSKATTITSSGIISFRHPHTRGSLVGWLEKKQGKSAEVGLHLRRLVWLLRTSAPTSPQNLRLGHIGRRGLPSEDHPVLSCSPRCSSHITNKKNIVSDSLVGEREKASEEVGPHLRRLILLIATSARPDSRNDGSPLSFAARR